MKKHQETKNLSAAQLAVIKRGQKAGLSEKQISVYSDAAFSPEQMEEIRLGLLEGLSPTKIRVFADPLVSVDEMARIRRIYRMSDEIEQGMDKLARMIEDAEHRSKTASQHRLLPRKSGR